MSGFTVPTPNVERGERIVVYHKVDFGEYRFDLRDLHETILAIEEGDVYLTNERMIRFFAEHEIATQGSNKWMSPASPLANFEAFREMVSKLVEEYDA